MMPLLDVEVVLGHAHLEVVLVVDGVHAFEPLVLVGGRQAHDLVTNKDEIVFVHGTGEDVVHARAGVGDGHA